MIRTKLFLAGALALWSPSPEPQRWLKSPANQITYFTFSAPFELPGGKVLPAGKYIFKIVDSPSNRHIVQVMSEDQKKMHATLLAIPAQRLDPAPEPEVRFMETAANTPPAVRTWWYPGRSIGHEFIYPESPGSPARRALRRESVLTVAADATSDRADADGRPCAHQRGGQETAGWAAADSTRSAQTTDTGRQRADAAQTQPPLRRSDDAAPRPTARERRGPTSDAHGAAADGQPAAARWSDRPCFAARRRRAASSPLDIG